MMQYDLYTIDSPYRDEGTLLVPTTPGLEVPKEGILRVPGYLERVREVQRGLRPPFWGDEYALVTPGPIADLVEASPHQFAASEALKRLLEAEGAEGVVFHPMRVDGRTTMYLLGVEGLVGVTSVPMRLYLRDEAEIGIFSNSFIHVNERLARAIQNAGLDMDVEPAELPLGYPGFPFNE